MTTLSEADSRTLVAEAGVIVSRWATADTADNAAVVAEEMGFPVVVKLCGEAIAHKTERGLVRLSLTSADDVRAAATDLLGAATESDGDVELLTMCGPRRPTCWVRPPSPTAT